MKKSGLAVSRVRCLLVGLALGVASAIAGGAGCSLGPKQDDPGVPTTTDTGVTGPFEDTGRTDPDGALAADAGGTDTYDPGASLDGCKEADGGDGAARDGGDGGCEGGVPDAPPDGDAGDAGDVSTDAKDEGGSDVTTSD